MPRTMPDDVAEYVDYVMQVVQAMMRAAEHQAKNGLLLTVSTR